MCKQCLPTKQTKTYISLLVLGAVNNDTAIKIGSCRVRPILYVQLVITISSNTSSSLNGILVRHLFWRGLCFILYVRACNEVTALVVNGIMMRFFYL